MRLLSGRRKFYGTAGSNGKEVLVADEWLIEEHSELNLGGNADVIFPRIDGHPC
jgi:hypothetical protein